MNFKNPVLSKKLILITMCWTVVAGLISSFHHWYGAISYATPWRANVSYWIMSMVFLACALLYLYWKTIHHLTARVVLWIFFFIAVIFQSGFIVFECIYSHVLKNLLYLSGLSRTVLLQLYPPPAYHLPDNWLFELTGLLQLVGLIAVWFALRVFQDRPWATHNKER